MLPTGAFLVAVYSTVGNASDVSRARAKVPPVEEPTVAGRMSAPRPIHDSIMCPSCIILKNNLGLW